MDAAASPQPTPTPPPEQPAVLAAWPRSAQLTTAFLLGVAVTLITVHVLSMSRWSSKPTQLQRAAISLYRIDLNHASRAELLQIPGIGPAMAERIEVHRREHGPFQSIDDLLQVHGIGTATLERVRPWVCVLHAPAPIIREMPVVARQATSTHEEPPSSRSAGKKPAVLGQPIDVNRATAEEFQQLPGIGPVLSQRIIEERSKRPFTSVDDLQRVRGIGPKTVEKLRPSVIVGNHLIIAE